MVKSLFEKQKKVVFPNDIVEVKVFQNKTNYQFNLPVSKRHTSPQIIKNILNNKDVIGLKFKITDVIFKDVIGKNVIFKNQKRGLSSKRI